MSTNLKSNSAESSLDRYLKQRFDKILATKRVDYAELPLLDFVPGVTPRYTRPEHLAPAIPYLEACFTGPQYFTLSAPPRHGKAIVDDTPMRTQRGWLAAKDVKVGDRVIGSDGEWTEVVGVYPQGEVDLYEVRFSDAARLTVCGDHRWSVRQRYYNRWRVKTTKELLGDLTEADGRLKWRIPTVAPVTGKDSGLFVDPYVLGVWLGDGTTARAEITSMDDSIVESIRSVYPTSYVYREHHGKAATYGIPSLRKPLLAHALIGNKHVPDCYKFASIQTRLAVLQGLADSDGTVAKNGSQQSICTTSEVLAADIKELICSLGGTYTDSVRSAAGKIAHNIYFRLPSPLEGFRLTRKRDRLASPSAKNRPRRFVKEIVPVGKGFARCFEVAAPDHLFCAGRDYVVTHNSETLFHFMAKFIAMYPDKNVAYASYSAKFAERKSMQVRDICRRAGVALDRSSASRGTWRTEAGGYFFARGPGGDLTGEGIHLLVCDDPYRSRAEAESATIRDNIYDWWTSVAMTRLEPGASVVCSHTRWHTDDLTGRLTEEQGWPNVSTPAIIYPYPDLPEGPDNEPRALWPERYSLADLARRRKIVGEYDWASMFMCQPRPRGGALFGSTNTYTDEDFESVKIVRYIIGIDLAYTAKTYSDYSVAVVLGIDELGNAYVVDVRRKQCAAKDFASVLKELRVKYRNPQIIWFVGGQEKAIAEFFRNSCGVPVKDIPARDDKFVRAQAAATAWNTCRIFVPADPKPWLDAFLSEVLSFTGVGDTHDDQVDALAAAFVPLAGKKVVRGVIDHRLLSF